MRTRTRVLQDLDSAAMREDEFPRDGEPQTAAAQTPAMDILALVEPIEYAVAVLGGNSRARVADVEYHVASLLAESQRDHTLVRRIFDCVRHQVRHHGAQFFLVRLDVDEIGRASCRERVKC